MTTRRTILGAALTLPLVGRPAAARQPDPAVAAVEALKAAVAVYDEACRLVDEIAAQHEGRIITPEDHAAYDSAVEAYDEAREAMVETVPTSAQGIRAMLHYHIKHDCFADPELDFGQFHSALIQKIGSDAICSSAWSRGIVAMPSGPEAVQRCPFHQSTWTLSPSPVGFKRARGAPLLWLTSE